MQHKTFTLEPPPRRVPMPLVLMQLTGGALGQFGWAFLIFSSIFNAIFLPNADILSHFYFDKKRVRVDGRITHVEATSFSEGGSSHRGGGRSSGRRISAVHFEYTTPEGQKLSGVSYGVSVTRKVGQTAQVEYPADRQNFARIVGMRMKPFPALVSFLLIFDLVALGMLFFGIRRGIRDWSLLRRGMPAMAKLIDKKRTNTQINKQQVYEFTFEFTDQYGAIRQVKHRTHNTDEVTDEDQERLLFDPNNPDRSVLVDLIHSAPKIDDQDRLITPSQGKAIAALVLPLLASAAFVISIYWVVLSLER